MRLQCLLSVEGVNNDRNGGRMSKLEELYQLFNHLKVETVFKKKGFVDMRFPFEVHNEIIKILCQSDEPKPNEAVEGMKTLLKIKADERAKTLWDVIHLLQEKDDRYGEELVKALNKREILK